MEKILRKVSVKDRLPEKSGRYYYTEIGELYFNGSTFINNNSGCIIMVRQPEYWYEEVDLKQAFEDYYFIKDLHNFEERQKVKEAFEAGRRGDIDKPFVYMYETFEDYLKHLENDTGN